MRWNAHLCQYHITIFDVTETLLFTCQKFIRIAQYLLCSSAAPDHGESHTILQDLQYYGHNPSKHFMEKNSYVIITIGF